MLAVHIEMQKRYQARHNDISDQRLSQRSAARQPSSPNRVVVSDAIECHGLTALAAREKHGTNLRSLRCDALHVICVSLANDER